jgi:uncharacterized protein (TIGR02246 family)
MKGRLRLRSSLGKSAIIARARISRMSAYRPEHVIEQLAMHVNAGNLDDVLALYEPDAVYLPRPRQEASGEQIRAAFAELFAMEPTMSGVMQRALATDQLALVYNDWHVAFTAPDGQAVKSGGISVVVLRRRADHSWGVVFDDPWAITHERRQKV